MVQRGLGLRVPRDWDCGNSDSIPIAVWLRLLRHLRLNHHVRDLSWRYMRRWRNL